MMALLDAKLSSPKTGGPSYSLGHRLERALWNMVWALLGSWTPPPLHGWRRFLLRLFGANIAPSAKIYPGVRIWLPRNLTMHEHACLGPSVNCYCMDEILLEREALVSQGAYLCGGSHDVDDPHFQLVTQPIRIGKNAWIAAGAFVGPGVTVGDNAVLGAYAVAMKDLEAHGIYVGNPAKQIRKRRVFDRATAGDDSLSP